MFRNLKSTFWSNTLRRDVHLDVIEVEGAVNRGSESVTTAIVLDVLAVKAVKIRGKVVCHDSDVLPSIDV